MGEEVTTGLNIKITADDLTGGAWSKLQGSIETAKEWVTPLNQAWELSAKLWGKIADAGGAAIDAISRGGELNETATAFERLSKATGLGGTEMLDSIRDITDGTVGLADAMQIASSAMTRGFSSTQLEAIMTFSKRYSEATGESMESTIDTIERAILTGTRLERVEMFGVHITKGQQMTEVVAELEKATAKLGDGAFNFGDLWGGALQGVRDTFDLIFLDVNRMIAGDGGVEAFSDAFMASIDSVRNNAAGIAAALWIPVKQMGEWLDTLFGGVDDLGTKTITIVSTVGNSLYDLMGVFAKVGEGYANIAGNIVSADKAVSDFMGNVENSAKDEAIMKNLEGISGWGDDLNAAQDEFNRAIMAAQTAEEKAMETKRVHAAVAEKLGDGIVAVAEKTEKAAAAVGKETKARSDALSQYEKDVIRYRSLGLDYTQTPGGSQIWAPAGNGQVSTQMPTVPTSSTGAGQQGNRIQLVAPPGDDLMRVIVDWINRSIVAEGAIAPGF